MMPQFGQIVLKFMQDIGKFPIYSNYRIEVLKQLTDFWEAQIGAVWVDSKYDSRAIGNYLVP